MLGGRLESEACFTPTTKPPLTDGVSSRSRMTAFAIVVSTLWALAHWYVGRRLIGGSSLATRPWGRRAGWAVLWIIAALPVIGLMMRRRFSADSDLFAMVAFALMGFSSILIVSWIAVDLLRASRHLTRRVRGSEAPTNDETIDPARRRFFGDLGRVGILGGTGALSGIGYYHATRVPPVLEVEVPVTDLPAELDGYHIVQISDVHIGPTIHGDWLEAVVDTINGLDADMVAVTGDIVDGFVDQLSPHVAPLAKLRSRDGTYYVTGNHEYYWDGLAWSEHFAQLGLRVLTNAHALVERGPAKLLVGGVTDLRAGGRVAEHASDPKAALAEAPPADFKLLLAHQPRSIYAATEAGWDLQLSGHTHGGQFFPFSAMIGLFQPYGHGLHRHADTSWIYVSRGTGYWGPPNRLGSPSEITSIRLRRAPRA